MNMLGRATSPDLTSGNTATGRRLKLQRGAKITFKSWWYVYFFASKYQYFKKSFYGQLLSNTVSFILRITSNVLMNIGDG